VSRPLGAALFFGPSSRLQWFALRLLASRAFSAYLLIWGLVELTYIPGYVFSFAHHASLTAITAENYLRNYDLIFLGFLFIRTVGCFAAANWFYNCGTKVEHFFFPLDSDHA
jgi:hypothetical protein